MPIKSRCKACGAGYLVVDSAAGRRVRCPACNAPFYVPGETRGTPASPIVTPEVLAELERNALSSEDAREALLRYRAAVSLLPPDPLHEEQPNTNGGGFLKKWLGKS